LLFRLCLHPQLTQIFTGKVTSDKMQKTIAVEVAQFYKHPKYHKYIKTSRKFLTHDEAEECVVGDVVEIRMCRRFSKKKHFTLHKILRPKLPFDVAAQRFMDHQPVWKQEAAIEEAQAAKQIPPAQ
jgi:small subunit ribosomal protein S17